LFRPLGVYFLDMKITKFVALIPAKSSSSRLPNKNFLPFCEEKTLLENKIKQCITSNAFDRIIVSSDSDQAEEIVRQCGVELLRRDARYCLDSTPWSEVTRGIISQVSVDENAVISWTPVTSPNFSKFESAREAYVNAMANGFDSLVTVTKFQHYYLDSNYLPINYQWGYWHQPSTSIKPLFQVNSALFMQSKLNYLNYGYQVGIRPYFMEIAASEGVDIDTAEDFLLAEAYRKIHHGFDGNVK
jgi:CMP-N-acetylneuraminic acid synthetase